MACIMDVLCVLPDSLQQVGGMSVLLPHLPAIDCLDMCDTSCMPVKLRFKPSSPSLRQR